MNKLYFSLILLLAGLFSNLAYAQPKKGEFINVSAGMGVVAPNDEADVTGSGFYAQGEYVWAPRTWFALRPYAGVIIASGESETVEVAPGVKEYIKSNAFLIGGKVRIAAPIPYVAPFLETGVGMSFGSFETSTQFVQLKKSGALVHIPFTLGLAIGKRHGTEVKFTYYYHNSVEQFSGAVAVGFSIPLNED
ncbi:hypothetical protein [Flavobacterium sp. AG291]|uniref:hypothetical protein n=1 Tax=Flavobacterium sp. AG291 TaxID=2184000 RepID=UPI000E0B1A69|nr:hypothetical protein [Flavobacterium sp. AG291]RDI10320.1 hypothetical protein DEU42_108137 [Flavobacterium sp. AG291]